jgi:NAD(P)-dependent dehydrogenase (short-subunit alcohol dehydrogenase family)
MTSVLVTGANRGIGLALTRALAGHDMRGERAGELRVLQARHPGPVSLVPLDVTRPESVAAAFELVRRDATRLDILVNNAAVLFEERETPFAEIDPDWFTQTVAVNVTGAARVTQAFLPLLLEAESPRVVNISSGAGSVGDKADARYYCYGASKAALNHLTIGLAHELRPRGVTVVALSPGWVRTDMGGPEAQLSPDESAAAIAQTILQLQPADSGCFLDRNGRRDEYVW